MIYYNYYLIAHTYDYIKDEFQKCYYILIDKLKDCEKLFDDREKYEESLSGKAIYERLKINNNIELLLKEIKKNFDIYKKRFKKDEEIKKLELLKKNYALLYNKYYNIEIKTMKIKGKPSLISDNNSDPGSKDCLPKNDNNSNENERPIYDIEQEIIDEFKLRVQKQDKKIDDLGNLVSSLKLQAKEIGEMIKGSNIQIKKIIPEAVVIISNVEKKTNNVNDLIKEIKKHNLCCDIILFLLLIGLICVLISIIRHKYF